MDKLNRKHQQLIQALKTLETTIEIFKFCNQKKGCGCSKIDPAEDYRIHRDSVVQRFEYCIDLFWKYLKKYLEIMQITVGINVPGEVVRTACTAKVLSEDEAENILDMIKSRNMTSHMYVEEVAELLAAKIPTYHAVMSVATQRLVLKISSLNK